jgi:phosphoribosylformylglycinamidine synthase
MVFRAYSVKKPGFDVEASLLRDDLRENLGLSGLERVVIANRYDVEGIDSAAFELIKRGVISEPVCDDVYSEELPKQRMHNAALTLGVEALPGQFDQRANSCAECIQAITKGARPAVAYAKLYAFFGSIEPSDVPRVYNYLINPVDSRLASRDKPATLALSYPEPEPVAVANGFREASDAELEQLRADYALAMDVSDLRFMQAYFRDSERRDPTLTELRVVDTYWSDHCRHTTFLTRLDSVKIDDPDVYAAWERYLALREELGSVKPVTLMDIATIGAKVLKLRGGLKELDESEEVNACSIHVDAVIGGERQDWLLMFKNETHNHPTEIEPFGGAATCIGGAIRDPLSGRAYVYQAMRVTGAADPRVSAADTIPGKLPQKKLTTTAAAGYSSYGNQIGLATGLVYEFYHPNYAAKRMEIGAVVGAAPAANVRRERPAPGDVVVLLGGRTGRDGIGGATGSSKAHDESTTERNGAEVQKGNAPEERKLQRLFRNPAASRLIKRCNDFGAGGVSVAIGELADGLSIDLAKVPKKYAGLNATELAISESQERMAVVIAPGDAPQFFALAESENLEATIVAEVTANPRMVMRFGGQTVVDLSREFLNSNGAEKHASASVATLAPLTPYISAEPLSSLVKQLRFASQKSLNERFDSSVGAGSVLFPYGGKYQRTPSQVMAALLPAPNYDSDTCSVMSFGFDPRDSTANPYKAAYNAVIVSVAKLVAAGADYRKAYLTFQEYFERLGNSPERWGKPLSALLGALDAQMELGVAAIGGKDSMSGSFGDGAERIDVPPTLVSFAIAPCNAENVISSEFKAPGHGVHLFPRAEWERVTELIERGIILAARAVEPTGAEGEIFKMCVGNEIGFEPAVDLSALHAEPGSIIAECTGAQDTPFNSTLLGFTSEKFNGADLIADWEGVLCNVFR